MPVYSEQIIHGSAGCMSTHFTRSDREVSVRWMLSLSGILILRASPLLHLLAATPVQHRSRSPAILFQPFLSAPVQRDPDLEIYAHDSAGFPR